MEHYEVKTMEQIRKLNREVAEYILPQLKEMTNAKSNKGMVDERAEILRESTRQTSLSRERDGSERCNPQ